MPGESGPTQALWSSLCEAPEMGLESQPAAQLGPVPLKPLQETPAI
jgi:hypothetical protein